MTDRELLEELFRFMTDRKFVVGDEPSIRDMVLRYKQPPLTLLHRVCMQMTVNDYSKLDNLMERIVEHFNPDNLPVPTEEVANIDALKPGDIVMSEDGKRLYKVNVLPDDGVANVTQLD